MWALIVMASVTLAELTRRHHKTARKYAARQGKRGALATGRAARRRWRALMARAAAWAGPRWQARRPAGPRSEPPAVTPARRVCAACGNPEGGKFGPLVTYQEEGPVVETYLIHRAHFEDPDTGYHGQPYTPGPAAGTAPAAGHPPYDTWRKHDQPARGPASRITPDRRARRTAARTGGSIPSEWGPVVAQAADFEPESDGHLLDWMAGQVMGMTAYAEALIEAYETGVGAVGIDPRGLAALHDVADAAAHAPRPCRREQEVADQRARAAASTAGRARHTAARTGGAVPPMAGGRPGRDFEPESRRRPAGLDGRAGQRDGRLRRGADRAVRDRPERGSASTRRA